MFIHDFVEFSRVCVICLGNYTEYGFDVNICLVHILKEVAEVMLCLSHLWLTVEPVQVLCWDLLTVVELTGSYYIFESVQQILTIYSIHVFWLLSDSAVMAVRTAVEEMAAAPLDDGDMDSV